jgi:phospholipase/lecithinase/hemolysin
MKIPSSHLRTRQWLAAIILVVITVTSALAGTAFSKLVVFGDSLNDTGNLYQFTKGVFPPAAMYANGRQSNGPVWVEYLAKRLGLEGKIANYAVIGALTKTTALGPLTVEGESVWSNVWSDTFPGLQGTDVRTQVQDYLGDVNGRADPAALFILEGGSNDLPRVLDPAVIISNLIESLFALQMAGAKHILVVNLPDAGKTPRVIIGEQRGLLPPGYGTFVSGVCTQLNQGLSFGISQATFPGSTITVADVYAFMNSVVANPAKFGLTQVQMPYLLLGAGSNPAQWLFWDDLHPTTRGHEIFAEQVVVTLVQRYSPGQGNVGKGAINSLNGLVKAPGR